MLHICQLVGEEPIFKKCDIKEDNLCVTGPTENLYILNAEVVLIPVWGAVFLDLWEIYELPLTSCVILGQKQHC